MLTGRQQRLGLGLGLFILAGISLVILLPVLTLLGSAAPSSGLLFDAYTIGIIRFTLLQAVLSTLLSILLGLTVALALARQTRFPGRIWLIRLMALPMGLPVLIGALGLIGIFGRQGLFNRMLAGLGVGEPISIYGLSGILLAHVFFNLPLAARLLLATLERLPQEYWRLSASLGMSSWSIFRLIELPILMRSMAGAAGLIFMLCATSFTLVLVLGGGPAATTLEVAIYQSLRFDFDPPRAVALSLLQIGLTVLILIALSLLPKAEDDRIGEGRRLRRFDGEGSGKRTWDGAVILLASLFLLLPLSAILIRGLNADLVRLAASASFHKALATSLIIALMAGLMSVFTALAILRAQATIRATGRKRWSLKTMNLALSSLSSLVLLVPPLVLGTGWFLFARGFGEVNRLAPFIIAVINMLMALPFVIRVLEPAYRTHLAQTDRLSASLGLFGLTKLRIVDWPVLRKPLLMALSFAMALSLGDLGAVALFSSQDLLTLPWLVYSSMGSYRTNDADGLALLLGLICLGLTMLGTLNSGERARDENHG
ncbi:thiamine/thiamine pyrophosphate ABC transporter permease ThiP [Rhizobium helianthi]|uniref:Thiamine/thiamine pyrophosphate ABC transporter permease ThiP n=1 Tax=Rhizobium helianthi TaxID=1132695 RepID=A0ABW4M4C0_9HYPH